MALISCPECKKEVSDTVRRCPHCGFVMRIIQWNGWIVGPYVISALALIFVLVDVNAVVDLTTDTFIGIVASLIGAAATIIVGLQVINHFTVIEKLRKIDKLEDDLKCENDKLCKTNQQLKSALKAHVKTKQRLDLAQKALDEDRNTLDKLDDRIEDLFSVIRLCKYYSHYNIGMSHMNSKQYLNAFRAFNVALSLLLNMKDSYSYAFDALLSLLENSVNNMDFIPESMSRMEIIIDIERSYTKIILNPNFNKIKVKYEGVFNVYTQKKFVQR